MIPNFNHSRYLDECIQSAIHQTYKNLEIVVLDNMSTDNSVEIASKYLLDKRVKVCRNQINILNRSYNILADTLTDGKYMMLLCADDYIYPDFIYQAVEIMETNPNVGYVHGEKDFVLADGTVQYWDPFFKCSFIAPGRNIMPIYMMTTVAHPSQGVFRRRAFQEIGGYEMEIDYTQADRALWFYLSWQNDAAYIREKMCGIRIGNQTETFIGQQNFQLPIMDYLIILNFIRFAREKEIPEVYNREEEAMEKLANGLTDCAIGILLSGNQDLAQAYIDYAKVVSRKICKNEKYILVKKMLIERLISTQKLSSLITNPAQKKRGYEPPKGYVELRRGIDYGKK